MSKQDRSQYDYLYRQSHPDEIEARRAISRQVKNGLIVRGECVLAGQGECGGRIEAHHYMGYGDIRPYKWVCSKHHHQISARERTFKRT